MQNENNLIEVDLDSSFRKPKKPLTQKQIDHLERIRELALEKKKEMKIITEKANTVKQYETLRAAKQLEKQELAKKYDEMMSQNKQDIQPPKVEEKVETPVIETPLVEKGPSKVPEKKKKIIKKVIYQEASSDSDGADEVEVVKVKKQSKPKETKVEPPSKGPEQPTYVDLLYQSSLEKMKNKMMDERAKYLVNSLMPHYN